MNREIEFRGFDGTKWYYGDLEYNKKTDVARIHTYKEDGSYDKQYAVNPDTVGQFTGLVDKNGVKIFEGDIVEMIRPVEKSRKRMLTRHIVTCHSVCDWVFESLAKEVLGLMIANHSDFDSYRFEVIGNIFDNPELAQPYSLNLPERKPRQRRRNNNVEIEIVMGDVKASTTVSQELAQELVKKISK